MMFIWFAPTDNWTTVDIRRDIPVALSNAKLPWMMPTTYPGPIAAAQQVG